MGRPSRKRPRPPSYSAAGEGSSSLGHEPQFPLDSHPLCDEICSDGLRSLVIGPSGCDVGPTTVQQVWGKLVQANIATAPASVEVDGIGVAWLVNTSTREKDDKRPPSLPVQSTSRNSSAATRVTSGGGWANASVAPETPSCMPPVSTRHQRHSQQSQDEIEVDPPSGELPISFDCDASLRDRLSRAKSDFDEIPETIFKRVRSACNPAEALGRGSFLNRSAMKLANIDAVVAGKLAATSGGDKEQLEQENEAAASMSFGNNRVTSEGLEILQDERMTSSPSSCHSMHTAVKPLLFADLCGGPGGFSEYLLRRRRQLGQPARGWGISLRETKSSRGGEGSRGMGRVRSANAAGRKAESPAVGEDHDNGNGSQGKPTNTVVKPAPEMAVRSPAKESSSEDVEEGLNVRIDEKQNETTKKEDPCAWRLDHLRPWCKVSVSTSAPGKPSAVSVSKLSHGGDIPGEKIIATPTSAATAKPTAAAVAPLLEMRIDYGPNGTGDVVDVDNMEGFVDNVLASTAGRRLDLVVADGGFGAARDALEQEELLSPLAHSEALAALLLLDEGGSFVCKFFECWTQSTAGLLYLLHRKFRRTAIVKPITSRPASGERYLVCMGYIRHTPSPLGCRFTNILRAKVQALQGTWRRRFGIAAASASGENERHRNPASRGVGVADGRLDYAALGVEAEMKQDSSFLWYLRHSNNLLANLQAEACARIVEVASTRRGRAWAFRDSNSSKNSCDKGGSGRSRLRDAAKSEAGRTVGVGSTSWKSSNGDGVGGRDAGAGGNDGSAVAMQCFREAWGLNGL